nr:hypothetical protein [Gordonia sp. NB41Y]KOY49805.1 hypothetical protein ISGA_07800 [Gordonia sp. NB41Y]
MAMPTRSGRVRSSLHSLRARVPGIGTVALVLAAALIATAGGVLAIGSPDRPSSGYTAGQLRSYPSTPDTAWTLSSQDLPDYSSDAGIEVAGTHGDRWLISYPSGIGRAYLLIERGSGHPIWKAPLKVGTGSCAITADGVVGCAVDVTALPDAFYLVDDDGTPTRPTPLDDTHSVVGVGSSFLRINQSGYRVTMRTVDGDEVWSRSFAATASAQVTDNGLLQISTNDATEFLVDPATGRDLLHCSQCSITTYPTGIAVSHDGLDTRGVDTYAVSDGTLSPEPTARSAGLRVVPGASTLPVLTATGQAQMEATQGEYEIRDPAQGRALWQITDPELSKANTRPCGAYVAFALKDRSRAVYALADGSHLGNLPEPDVESPDTNIDQLRCVGSTGGLLVFANGGQITAFDPARGSVAWAQPILGRARVVDGFVVLEQGTTLSMLRPH